MRKNPIPHQKNCIYLKYRKYWNYDTQDSPKTFFESVVCKNITRMIFQEGIGKNRDIIIFFCDLILFFCVRNMNILA